MSRNRKLWLIAGLCTIALACDHAAKGPVAPTPGAAAASAVTGYGALASAGDSGSEPLEFDANAAPKAAAGGSANGHAEVQGTPVQGIQDERYSFIALPDGNAPLAKGQVQVHFLTFAGMELRVHAEVTCVSVEGNQAWVGTRVTSFVRDGEEIPGERRMIFRVQDTGDDAGSTDLASLVFFGAAGLDLTHCNTRQAFPILRASTTGNIQVKPE
jgi:hypothetical protein